jgi:drug/metabolite transporter (DMT)-like permease
VAFALVSAVSFGLSGPIGKSLIEAGWSSNGALLVRLGGAAVVLAGVLAVVRPGVLASVRRDGPALVLYGALGMAGAQGAYFNAVRYVPVSVALLFEYTGPVLVIGWVWLVRGRPPTRRTLLGGLVALVGLSLVLRVWTGFGVDWRGVAWGLLAAVCAAGYFLIADRAGVDTPPLVLAGIGMVVGTLVVVVFGVVGLLPVVVSSDIGTVNLAGTRVGWLWAAALLVLVPTVLAYLTGIAAIGRIGASRASLIGLIEVVSAAVASWLLLGEVPAPAQLVGGALILFGVALTQNARPAADTLPEVTEPATSGTKAGADYRDSRCSAEPDY